MGCALSFKSVHLENCRDELRMRNGATEGERGDSGKLALGGERRTISGDAEEGLEIRPRWTRALTRERSMGRNERGEKRVAGLLMKKRKREGLRI